MRYLLVLLCSAMLLASCHSSRRATYNYLEQIQDSNFHQQVYIAEPVIQKNDLLSIQIYSLATDPKVDQLYNVANSGGAAGGGGGMQTGQQSGYLVDFQGNLELPRLGIIHAEGLTKTQLVEEIKKRIGDALIGPTVIVRFMNFKITVLGEVGNPGVLNIQTERLSIIDAIGMAGGVTQYGTIKHVKVLRENNGVREVGILDLTSPEQTFSSKYYQLQQNDVVLVDQTPYKLRQTEQQRVSQQLGFALTIVTSIALLYNIFK